MVLIYRGKPQGRSGQIPAFGNWDQVKELPITQYFENARQAGLKPSHSREFGDHYVAAPSRNHPPHLPYTKNSYKGRQKRPNQLQTQNISSAVVSVSHRRIPPITKPVDEDLYQVPSEALQNSKRKKLFGFFSRCFMPHTR
ncbi:hypothetical protein DCAR_0206226 [Daucus carota subsp. sativus]|uniref:RIN4 pathogenic type III effector avirulence factor Avr cleavage site domain-containing protein n=1 Tax=Daucus carota subsp. sativus TaxID=79200 RepID=A0AAF0WCS1_DAUCS|nr:hypothetical protein DCAR_0206226 [Daucus carota subsp. sativus]